MQKAEAGTAALLSQFKSSLFKKVSQVRNLEGLLGGSVHGHQCVVALAIWPGGNILKGIADQFFVRAQA